MPVNKEMMSSMKKEYWTKKGKNVYYAMENKLKGEWKKIPINKVSTSNKKK